LALLLAQLEQDTAWIAFATIMTNAITDHSLPPALESAQADADLAANADQACTSGMGLAGKLNCHPVSLPRPPSRRLTTFFAAPARLPSPQWLSPCAAAPS